ncbi:MAG: hypothetical protein JWO38_1439 [Gemmataceae bacterium]|nr:hypothetical protein [Gemmataceae bacterium]
MAGYQGGSASDLGCVEVGPPADKPLTPARSGGSPIRLRSARYTWRPPPDLVAGLPADFALEFDCYAGPDGVRRFVPREGLPTFIPRAALGGFGLLTRRGQMASPQRFSYRASQLLYQLAPGLREHLDRTFARESDLYVPAAGRGGADDRHVLPEDLGRDGRGNGAPWTPRDLLARGRAAAGDPAPTPAGCIRLGLLAAARLNPMDPAALPEVRARALVRLALFDLGPLDGGPDEAVIATVEGRLSAALERHGGDDTAAFNRWFFKNTDTIVHAIAKQKKGGGPLPRARVRQALLELVFRSFASVGDCVHVQMTAFARALPDPLTGDERALFDSLYRKQPHLGGLPLVLLHDRFAFLREAILDVWDDPHDPARVGALLQLLSYYGIMVGKKREADRRYKAQSGQQNDRGRPAVILALDPGRDAPTGPPAGRFQAIAGALRDARGATCRCGSTQDWRATLVAAEEATDPVVIEDECERCGHRETIPVTREQIREAGRNG